MKKWLWIPILFFLPHAQAAAPSSCQVYGAELIAVTLQTNPTRALNLCRFGLSSIIEENTLVRSAQSLSPMSAVQSYKQNVYHQPCTQNAAFVRKAIDDKGTAYFLCSFGDFSYMETQTFARGPNSGFNTQMDWALGIHLTSQNVRCVPQCKWRSSTGACNSYGSDFCAPDAVCVAHCTWRGNDGVCQKYDADFCGSDVACLQNCELRSSTGACLRYGEDTCN